MSTITLKSDFIIALRQYQNISNSPDFPELSETSESVIRTMSTWQENSDTREHLHLLTHEHSHKSKQTQQVCYVYSPTCKHSVYGKQPGYLPTSEAITVMLCQDISSLSRGCVVRISPLLSSILKYLTPSSLLSKKYLLGKENMILCIRSRCILKKYSDGKKRKRLSRWQWIICRLQSTVRWWPVSMDYLDLQVKTCQDFQVKTGLNVVEK